MNTKLPTSFTRVLCPKYNRLSRNILQDERNGAKDQVLRGDDRGCCCRRGRDPAGDAESDRRRRPRMVQTFSQQLRVAKGMILPRIYHVTIIGVREEEEGRHNLVSSPNLTQD